MEWIDALKILFGAVLGLVISQLQVCLTARRDRKRAEKMLRMELPTIRQVIDSFANSNRIIPLTELPTLQYVESAELSALPAELATDVYNLIEALKRTEISRLQASTRLNNQDAEFQVHAQVYWEYLHKAQKSIDKLMSDLKQA
jgi:hypothetical protein